MNFKAGELARTVVISAVVSVCVSIGGRFGNSRVFSLEKDVDMLYKCHEKNRQTICYILDFADRIARHSGMKRTMTRKEVEDMIRDMLYGK